MKSRILKVVFLSVFMASVFVGVTVLAVTAQDNSADVKAKIDDAMSAAPLSIAKDAAIMDYTFDANGKFVVLRAGTNGWSCFPDDPSTPKDNPMCLDEVWVAWFYALLAGKAPNITVPGFAYMLQGDDGASNTDPTATKPAAGEDWMSSPPHIMILLPPSIDISSLGTDEHSSRWVMFAGTPYQHIMVAVEDNMAGMAGMGS